MQAQGSARRSSRAVVRAWGATLTPSPPGAALNVGASVRITPVYQALERSIELASVGALDALRDIVHGQDSQEVDGDRHASLQLATGQHGAQQGGLAIAPGSLQPAVAGVERARDERLGLGLSIHEVA